MKWVLWSRYMLVTILSVGILYVGYVAYTSWQVFGSGEARLVGQSVGPGKKGPSAPKVRTVRPTKRALIKTIEAVGSVRAVREVEIKPFSSGRLIGILYEAGKTLSQGDILFKLEDSVERSEFASSQAELAKAQKAYLRGDRLRRSNITARESVDVLNADLAVAKARYERARKQLADRTIKAPFSGVAGLSRYDLGSQVEANSVLTRLDDTSQILVDFSLSEVYFPHIFLGQEVDVSILSTPGHLLKAVITQIDRQIDRSTRTFHVRAKVSDDPSTLVSGMFVSLVLSLSRSSVMMLPEEAILVDGNKFYVLTVERRKVSRKGVEIGSRTPGWVEIVGGILPDTEVISSGISKVYQGDMVQVISLIGGKDGP